MTLGNAPVAREGFSPGPGGEPDGNTRHGAGRGTPPQRRGALGRDLAADPSGWYARIGTRAIRAYHHTAAPVRGF